MPPSLNAGPSRIVPIKCDDSLRADLESALTDGETISSLTRELWRKEIAARLRKKNRKNNSEK